MDINWKTNLYSLIGNPINGSLSPIIHNHIFKKLNLNSIYLAFNIEEEDFENALKGIRSLGIKGFNVTLPYKKKIMDYLDEIDYKAEAIGAVNTVKNIKGKLIGYNTDGDGFIQSLADEKIDLKDKDILILGAGGAAYAVAVSLALNGVNSLTLANRTEDKAGKLKEKIDSLNKNVEISVTNLGLGGIGKVGIDIIVNTTSLGMYPREEVSPIDLDGFSKDTLIYDLIYKPKRTKLMEEGEELGMKTINGMAMLINQALLSQNIWGSLDMEKNKNILQKLEDLEDLCRIV